MNKWFLFIIITASFLSVYVCSFDMLRFPKTQNGEIFYLKNFKNEFPDIKQPGFYTDIEFPGFVLYRIQNTIAPVMVKESIKCRQIFCYSRKKTCQEFIENGSMAVLKKYNDNMFLLQTFEDMPQ